jgi:SAM-dependent methyltransferase
MNFNDHFSRVATGYATYRPRYPEELFSHLAGLCRAHDRVVDCGTGSGQAAIGLAPFFTEVVAIDPSAQQLASATAHERVRYAVAPAEQMPVDNGSVDLVTAAAAAHWFQHDPFHSEVRRVLKPGGIVALWTYWNAHISPTVDAVLERFQFTVVGPYWPPERKYVNSAYRELPFPFSGQPVPAMDVRMTWSLEHFTGYLGTWSAVDRYRAELGTDPIDLIRNDLRSAWGDGERLVRWPLAIRIGKV